MKNFVSIPVHVTAVQFDGSEESFKEVEEFLGEDYETTLSISSGEPVVLAHKDGFIAVRKGEFAVKDESGTITILSEKNMADIFISVEDVQAEEIPVIVTNEKTEEVPAIDPAAEPVANDPLSEWIETEKAPEDIVIDPVIDPVIEDVKNETKTEEKPTKKK